MQEPGMTGATTGAAPPGETPGTGTAPPPESYTPLTMEDMLKQAQDRFPQPRPLGEDAGDDTKALAEEVLTMKFERFIEQGAAILDKRFPDSTEDQQRRAIDAMVSMDLGELSDVFKDIVQLSEEKESREDAGEALGVEGSSTAPSSDSSSDIDTARSNFMTGIAKKLGLSTG